MIKQVRIFAPFKDNYKENWAENIMGRIIKPASDYSELDWFWFSRYAINLTDDSGDCDPNKISGDYINGVGFTRSLRFRYSILDEACNEFEKDLKQRILENGCFMTHFLSYDMVGDVGDNRHLGGIRNGPRRMERAKLITQMYYKVSLLTLNILEGPRANNQFAMEKNDSTGMGESDSSFAVPHHLFCNTTGVPLHVFLRILIEAHNVHAETRTISWDEEPNWAGYHTDEEQIVPIDRKIRVSIKF